VTKWRVVVMGLVVAAGIIVAVALLVRWFDTPATDACGHDLSHLNARVIAIDAGTGTELWMKHLHGSPAYLWLENPTTVRVPSLGSDDDTLLDVATGRVVGRPAHHMAKLEGAVGADGSPAAIDLLIDGVSYPDSMESGGLTISTSPRPVPDGMYVQAVRQADGVRVWSVGPPPGQPSLMVTRFLLVGNTVLFAASDPLPACGV
jgi:hypothetical protein